METVRQKKIAVMGISQGAGTTFLSVSLAFLLAVSNNDEKSRKLPKGPQPARVTLLELQQPEEGRPMLYYHAGLDRRFLSGRFTDFLSVYQQTGSVPQGVNLHKGINWAVRRTRSAAETAGFPLDQMAGEYLIADSPPLETLQLYDLIIGVIDPMPSAVYAGTRRYEIIRDLEESGLPVIWVMNRDSEEVDHTALKRFLKLKEYFSIPVLDRKLFYRAEYTGRLPVELLEGVEKACMEDFAGQVKAKAERKKRPGGVPERFDTV